jgi:epoxyqueuosine reductase
MAGPLNERIKAHARALGFELVGIAPAAPADGFVHLQDWLAQGYAGEMAYMSNHGDARRHPESILPDVRSVVMVGISYKPAAYSLQPTANSGRVSCYAGRLDYHDVIRDKLKQLLAFVQSESPNTRGRAVIDTAPLLERDFARRAGLGWFGKNTMLIDTKLGSYFFLGALLLDLAVPIDQPFETAHCGSCTRCLDACPTDAFVAPYQLDARRCISYLTIELRASIAEELRPSMGDWIFGCDVCQDVCPWNRKSPPGQEVKLRANVTALRLDLIGLLGLDDAGFRARFRHTPLWRTKRSGLLRNAAIALGNIGNCDALAALERVAQDGDSVVRDAAHWAIAQIRARYQFTVESSRD